MNIFKKTIVSFALITAATPSAQEVLPESEVAYYDSYSTQLRSPIIGLGTIAVASALAIIVNKDSTSTHAH